MRVSFFLVISLGGLVLHSFACLPRRGLRFQSPITLIGVVFGVKILVVLVEWGQGACGKKGRAEDKGKHVLFFCLPPPKGGAGFSWLKHASI